MLPSPSIALGYLPLAVVWSVYVTGTTGETTLTRGLAHAVLLAGILLPAGLGAGGGYGASLRACPAEQQAHRREGVNPPLRS